MSFKFELQEQLPSLEATSSFGTRLGKHLTLGSIVCLFGEMGSGKTTLCKSICSSLGIHPNTVISPTYTIVNLYEGILPVHHVDLYRFTSPEELYSIDENDLFCFDGITLIEWPQFVFSLLEQEEILSLHLTRNSETSRHCQLEAEGNFYQSLFETLAS